MERRVTKILRLAADEATAFFGAIVLNWPGNGVGARLRARFYRRLLSSRIGRNASFSPGAVVSDHPRLKIGDNFVLGKGAHVIPDISLGILIGDDVSIAHGAYVRGSNHCYFDLAVPMARQGHFSKTVVDDRGAAYSVIIDDDVMIGAYAVILSGAKIGKGAIIAAGAVVSSDVPAYAIVAGNPGRAIGTRESSAFAKNIVRFAPDAAVDALPVDAGDGAL